MNIGERSFAPPSYWDRLLARIFDGLIFTAIGYIAAHYLTNPSEDSYRNDVSAISSVLFAIQWFLYYPIMEGNGGTLGKRFQGLKTLSTRPGASANFIQGYAKMLRFMWPIFIAIPLAFLLGYNGLDSIEFMVIGVPGVYCAYLFFAVPGSVDENNQGKHDKYAKLMVIKHK